MTGASYQFPTQPGNPAVVEQLAGLPWRGVVAHCEELLCSHWARSKEVNDRVCLHLAIVIEVLDERMKTWGPRTRRRYGIVNESGFRRCQECGGPLVPRLGRPGAPRLRCDDCWAPHDAAA